MPIYTLNMECNIRDIETSDLEAVLALNQDEVPHVGSIDLDRMQWFASNADYFRVATVDKQLAAYLVGLRPGSSYQSLNYRWFCDRYDDFAYIDRIAVSQFARRCGLASRLYDDFARSVPASVHIMTCEVNLKPPNESSMRFHEKLGFRQVGSLASDDGDKEVAMLLKNLRARARHAT
ncbi:MAG: GNAT family N-acetyltransferase [Desulfobulbaceae bacterium]|nr:GNAT family N-acetyltransferase [Desulfobulbaceae bacterium]